MKQSNFYHHILTHPVVLRYTRWEYLPVAIANVPVFLIALYFAIRARKLTFFAAVNPAIDTGGVFGESKIDILRQLPEMLIPETIFVKQNTTLEEICCKIQAQGMKFPIIAKPNVGERGQSVSKLKDLEDLTAYWKAFQADFIIQTFIDFPKEVSVLYCRYPNKTEGSILSLCLKEFLSVTGDGKRNVAALMADSPRANIQLKRFLKQQPELMRYVPALHEKVELEPIGNHSRGTTFLNGNPYITEKLVQVFDQISHQLEGIYYGRYDIKCESLEAMEAGTGFKILEFNGVAGEPAHVYDPSYPVWKKYRDIYKCWKTVYEISEIQHRQGVSSMNFQEAWSKYGTYRRHIKNIKLSKH